MKYQCVDQMIIKLGMILALMIVGYACDQNENTIEDQMLAYTGPWTTEKEFPTEGAILNVFGNDQITFAVGGQPNLGRIWYQNKNQPWVEDQSLQSDALLNWGSMIKLNDDTSLIWVVGSGGKIFRKKGDMRSWESIPSPTNLDLWGVWTYSENEAWAVGGNAADENSQTPALIKWNGMSWENVEIPELDRSGMRALFKVFGIGKWVFAVGMKGVIIGAQRDSNGVLGDWKQYKIKVKEGSIASTEDLISLWGIDENQIMAVGGRSNGVIVRWDGQEWMSSVLTGVPGLNGIWMDQSGRSHTVGVRGAILTFNALSWAGERKRTDTTLVLHSIWGTQEELWAVGGSLDDVDPWIGIILNQN